ncbi:MAG: hypothetical protein RJB31_59 [Bacteroidota bacterium]|jgi:hypothetical protein
MQYRSNNKRNPSSNQSFSKTVLGRIILLVFASTFFLQQLQAVSFLNSSISYNKSAVGFFETTQDKQLQISTLSPQASAKTIIEMELAEDEDKHIGEQETYSHFYQKNSGDELAYHCILQSRYLQLISSLQKKTEVEYFILYHSWKKHIA